MSMAAPNSSIAGAAGAKPAANDMGEITTIITVTSSALTRNRFRQAGLASLLVLSLVVCAIGAVTSPSFGLRGVSNSSTMKIEEAKGNKAVLVGPSLKTLERQLLEKEDPLVKNNTIVSSNGTENVIGDNNSSATKKCPSFVGRIWTELRGKPAAEAVATIRKETKGCVLIQVVGPPWIVTADHNTKRVRIFVWKGRVIISPSVG